MSSRQKRTRLGTFFTTAIAGNDILSSTLYVSGIAVLFAGVFAPLILLAVALVLFLYRSVYREVVEMLPVNGGAYNALINSTSKTVAAIAGIMTILSYIATAVISAKTSVEYLFQFLEEAIRQLALNVLPHLLSEILTPVVIAVLLIFAILVISGVKASAKVAGGIFIFHLLTLATFIIMALAWIASQDIAVADILRGNILSTAKLVLDQGGWIKMVFFAFATCLLGISGFQTAADFVEEQKKGAFAKALTYLSIGTFIISPLIAFVVLRILSLDQITAAQDFVLATAAYKIGGFFLLSFISIDAFLVLGGAVLASYISVSSLIHRMALDRCLPSSLVDRHGNRSHIRIVLIFFALCTSILLLTRGQLLSLAGVYTISFLSVMALFTASNFILRHTRPELHRPYRAPLSFVLLAFFITLLGLMGNIALDPKNTAYFLIYFVPATTLTICVLHQRTVFHALRHTFRFFPPLHRFFEKKYEDVARDHIYVFIRHVDRLFPILNYIHQNEGGQRVTLLHCR